MSLKGSTQRNIKFPLPDKLLSHCLTARGLAFLPSAIVRQECRTSYLSLRRCMLLLMLVALLTACRSSRHADHVDYRQLARAAIKLGFDVEPDDNHQLMIESASWIGTPYQYGGNTRRGTDCSGMVSAIYKQVYQKALHRSSEDIYKHDCHHISQHALKQGDLVFFATSSSKKVSHVGIYLKDGRFIHASTSRGVIVSGLDEDYYRKRWVKGGRVK